MKYDQSNRNIYYGDEDNHDEYSDDYEEESEGYEEDTS